MSVASIVDKNKKAMCIELLRFAMLRCFCAAIVFAGIFSADVFGHINDGDRSSAKIAQVNMEFVRYTENGPELREAPVFAIELLVSMPEDYVKAQHAEITSVVTDKGVDLISEDEKPSRILGNFSAQQEALVEFLTDALPIETNAFRVLEGYILYDASDESRKVRWQLNELIEGMENELDAQILDIKQDNGDTRFTLNLPDVRRSQIASVSVLDDRGQAVDMEPVHSSQIDILGETSLKMYFNIKGGIPEGGTLEVDFHEKIEERRLQFQVKNVSVLGFPLDDDWETRQGQPLN